MAEHFTLRLRSGTSERLGFTARRAGIPPRTLAQRYIEEGLRREDHPLVRFADGPSGRRAALVGSGLDVCEVIAAVHENGSDAERTAATLAVPVGLVQAAIAYYGDYREEIDSEIALNQAEWERGFAAWEAGSRALAS